jgi:parallel beta-helix repeat protein
MGRASRGTSSGSTGALKRLLLCALLGGALSIVVGVGQAAAAPPTAVTCGSTIVAKGQYYLAADCGGAGITITASQVHLKLEGHTMSGPGLAGISASGVSKLYVEGPGTITNYNFGMLLDQVDDSHVAQVTMTADIFGVRLTRSHNDQFNDDVATDGGLGFQQAASSGIHYVDVTASNNNAGFGISGGSTATHIDGSTANSNIYGLRIQNSSDIHVDGSTANGNFFYGIWVQSGATGNDIHGNTALGNSVFDLNDDNPNCDSSKWDGNQFNTANQPCIS